MRGDARLRARSSGHERPRAKDEAKIRGRWGQGRLGSIAVALTAEKRSTTAWKSGATGESKVGARLDEIVSERVVVLHHRRIPRSRANIDHIVVTLAGVWVIDAKRYVDKRPELRIEGGLLRPPVEKLVVGGDQTKLVDGVLRQVDLVREVVVSEVGAIPVTGALCFVDADWPMFGGAFRVRDVEVLRPTKLVKLLEDADGPVDVAATAAAIARRFPPA